MSDIHPLPLVGHDLPMNKLKIRKGAFSGLWIWSHVCPDGWVSQGDHLTHEQAFLWGRLHMRRHHGVRL